MSGLVLIGKILVAILIFGLIIFVHELGHFIMAKLMGVKVNEFALGMGPQILKFGKKETVYSLRLFPIGGFCAMEGEDEAGGGSISLSQESSPAGEDLLAVHEPDPRAFCNKKVWRRVLIVVAGAFMNLVLGLVLLISSLAICTTPNSNGDKLYATTAINALSQDSPISTTGLQPGDTILKINGKTLFSYMDMSMLLYSDEDGIFDMVVRRPTADGDEKITLTDVTFDTKVPYYQQFVLVGIPQTFGNTITQAVKMEGSISVMVWRALGDLITGKNGLKDLSGPVGTVDIIGDTVGDAVTDAVQGGKWQESLSSVIMLITMITVNVGIFNLLPLPALDGGRLIFLLIEGVTRHKVPAKYEGLIHAIGLILLLVLMVFVTFGDISRIFTGG